LIIAINNYFSINLFENILNLCAPTLSLMR